MNKIMKHSRTLAKKATLVAVGVGASASAFAVDHSDAIAAATKDATTNVTAAATSVIAVVAIIFGISLVISMFRK